MFRGCSAPIGGINGGVSMLENFVDIIAVSCTNGATVEGQRTV